MSVIGGTNVRRVAVMGGGVIGGGWTARMLENGLDVAVFDPSPEAPAKVRATIANAERAYLRLHDAPRRDQGALRFASSVADAVADADFVIEAAPERKGLKRDLYAEIEAAGYEGPIGSSTSFFKPTELQSAMRRPERLLVTHPFNPVYLLPLVELVGGEATDAAAIEAARALFDHVGMKPLHVRGEIDGFIADRLMEAVWRECLWLVKDGVATTEEIDDAVRFGFGLRWAQMGVFETFRIAGGPAGMRHFMEQFGPTLSEPTTKLMDVPDLNDALIDRIAEQSDDQAAGRTIGELERARDDNLVAILHALRGRRWGAGRTLAEHEDALEKEAARALDASRRIGLDAIRRAGESEGASETV